LLCRLQEYFFIDIDLRERNKEEEKTKLEARIQQAQKMESIGRLAGGVAHDFNNMLTIIMGYADMALSTMDSSEPLHANLTAIYSAAKRSADLTRQLLAFASKQANEPKILDLNQALAGMISMVQRLIGEGIQLKWQPDMDLWPVKVDPSQIDQILANLCLNARDAITDIGTITVETGNRSLGTDYFTHLAWSAPGEYACLCVSDNGRGMDQEILTNIYEPFYTTKGVGKGTGLGLATVFGIVKQNNGFINVYSEPEQGTTFEVYLPRYPGHAEQSDPEGASKLPLCGRETILLVEDDPGILEMTSEMLTRLDYQVLKASNPIEAINLARERDGGIDLILTDVVMPEMNGRDLAKSILALYPDIKHLYMSGYTANVIESHGVLDAGIQFIQKPFTLHDLATKVREVVDSR